MPMIKSHHLSFLQATPSRQNSAQITSHKTQKYTVEKQDHFPQPLQIKSKEWVFKNLSDVRESCCEAVCGELYRYLIGGPQPKTRTLEKGNVASEYVPFQSCTDFFLNKLTTDEKEQFVFDFRMDLSGFVQLLISSIFLEENDLHDGNFGLDRKTGKFIKIDHGQSLNENRTHRPLFESGSSLKKQLKDNMVRLAHVKFWSRPAALSFFKKHQDPEQKNRLNRKTDRQDFGSGFSQRKYRITPQFIDGLFRNYFADQYNMNLIRKLGYSASASPLFDQRFVVFGLLQQSDLDDLERYKYDAIAKILLTPDSFYLHVIQNAAEFPKNSHLLEEIQQTILSRKQELLRAVSQDQKFLDHVSFQWTRENIQDQIHESILLMQFNHSGTMSKRYGGYLKEMETDKHSFFNWKVALNLHDSP